ncbi:zwei Ig domain protein zig-8 isoform X1 [Sitodiplosis mosellana]|uniref:zwei Ig domain protein zig-8 isoform X1 n=1 Tax=Sitodiplosis mosellana TaxID=263140 RepID=UPI0024437FDF|nr:zwei Ig domain protein zig-8 isoform X1 [Sitodiplosis mosellana]XP_055311277.1 zwei Ig domain protein zig-8 isoform X1 [Sitodiplosis mosellana]XP_055311278.1 zwei Ig domain protein zig-8 isoform X1 [Sitodiplosis mosellana]
MFYRLQSYYFGFILIILHTKIKETLSFNEPHTPASSNNSSKITAAAAVAATTMSSSIMTTTDIESPYFDFELQRNVTVTVGQTGFLHCRVERLGDKDVSWIRKRDLHILTAGTAVYTSDQRFQVQRPQNSTLWTLQIKYPQVRDAGVYECQVSTEPKISLSYTLNVIELKAVVLGTADLYVKTGSDINLTCKISKGPHELGTVFWYKGNAIIDLITQENDIYSENVQRISVDTDWADGLISRLKIRQAVPNDTGNYTCVSTIAQAASVYAHVISGSLAEHPAAMQHNSANMQFVEQPTLVLPLVTIAAGGAAAIATNLMDAAVAVITSILLEIWIVLARFQKNLFNTLLWPSASVWVVR